MKIAKFLRSGAKRRRALLGPAKISGLRPGLAADGSTPASMLTHVKAVLGRCPAPHVHSGALSITPAGAVDNERWAWREPQTWREPNLPEHVALFSNGPRSRRKLKRRPH